jgi:hypothetical protein
MRVLILGAVAALCAGAAMAKEPASESFGNTVEITDSSGATTKRYLDADGTLTVVDPSGAKTVGKWFMKDGDATICNKLGTAPEECYPYAADKNVGDSWETPGPDGKPVKVSIKAGR